jgi:hypothetical protein
MSFVGRNNKKITNRPSGGGDKKQGLAPKATHFFRPVSTGSQYSIDSGSGQDRFNFFCINQLGNIGGGRNNSMFGSSSDGPNVNFQFALAKQQGFNTTFNNDTDSNIIIDPLLGKEITIYPIPGTWTGYKGYPVSPTFLNPQPWLTGNDIRINKSWIEDNGVWYGRDNKLFNTIIFIQLTPPISNTADEIFNAIKEQAVTKKILSNNVTYNAIYYTYNVKYNQVIYDDNLTKNPTKNKLPNGQTYIYIKDESIKNIKSNVVIIITLNKPIIPASAPLTISGANNFSSMLNLCILNNVITPPQDYTTKVNEIKEHAKKICEKMDGNTIYFCTTDGNLFIPDDPNNETAQKPQFIYQHWGYTNNGTIYYTPSLYIPNSWTSSNTLYIDFKGNYDYNLTTTLIVFDKNNFPNQDGTKIIENFTDIIKGICSSNNQTAIFQMQNYLEIFKQYPYPPGVKSFSGGYYTPYLTCNIHIFGENNNLSSESILDNWLGIPWINNTPNVTNARATYSLRLDKIKNASGEDLALAIQAWSNAGAIEIYTNGDVKIFDLNITGFIPRGRSGIQINGYNSKRGGYIVFTNNIADICKGLTPVVSNLDDPNYLSSKVSLSRINILNNWIYQADGFDVISPGLDMNNCIVQSGDDGIKLQSSNSIISNISSIQGNSGGAIAIGGYGFSKYNKPLENIDISGISIMRICQSYKGSEDYNSAIINIINNTTNNGDYNNIRISNIYVPEIYYSINEPGINQPNMFFTLGWWNFGTTLGGPTTAGIIKNIKIQNAYIYSQPAHVSIFFLEKNAKSTIPGGPDPSSNIIIPLNNSEFVLDLTTNVFIVSDPTKPPFVWYENFAGFLEDGQTHEYIYIPDNGQPPLFGKGRGYLGSMNNSYDTLPFLGQPKTQGSQNNPDPNILPSLHTGGTNIDTILPVLIETAAAPAGFEYVAKGIKI